MRATLDHIAQRREAFRRAPFFAFLRDASRSALERFAFAPAAAPFVMAFSDLNNIVLHRPEARRPESPFQRPGGSMDPPRIGGFTLESILDEHAAEDGSHFRLYLQDIVTLGLDTPSHFAETLAFLWSEERRAVRRTCYTLTALLAAATPMLRLVVVEAIEATGSVAFPAFRALADELYEDRGITLRYFGRRHEALETGHIVASPVVTDEILAIVLNDAEREQARHMVDIVFDSFEDMMSEVLVYCLSPRAGALP